MGNSQNSDVVGYVSLATTANGVDILKSIDNDIKNVCKNNRDEIESIILESIRLIRKKNKVPNKRESIELLARLKNKYLYAKKSGEKELNDLIELIINNPIF